MPKKEKVSPEDSALFRDSIERLPETERTDSLDDTFEDEPLERFAPNVSSMHLNADDQSSFYIHSFDAKILRKLKAGKIPFEASVDLHGMTSDQAYNALLDFIDECRLNQCRCVRVVHGKGAKFAEKPILKNKVDYWLRRTSGILAFVSAQPKYGGTGALIVYLKRGEIG